MSTAVTNKPKVPRIDLTGQRFGRLVVVGFAGFKNDHWSLWLCQCDCGSEHIVTSASLRGGKSKSCGCLQRELCSSRATTHGLSKSPEYICWNQMIQRCTNPAVDNYSEYGGRGIKVCDRWLSFENFYADMGPKPSPGHSIERENNDGNYELGNCRWATKTEQARNRRSTKRITAFGVTASLAEWAERTGIPYHTLKVRLSVLKWDTEKALMTPVKKSAGAS